MHLRSKVFLCSDNSQWLKKTHEVLLIHAGRKQRAMLVNDSQGVIRTDDEEEESRSKTRNAGNEVATKVTILISTPQLIGTGFTGK